MFSDKHFIPKLGCLALNNGFGDVCRQTSPWHFERCLALNTDKFRNTLFVDKQCVFMELWRKTWGAPGRMPPVIIFCITAGGSYFATIGKDMENWISLPETPKAFWSSWRERPLWGRIREVFRR